MKERLCQVFGPILRFFEDESDELILTPTNRKVTLFIGATFVIIAFLIPIIGAGYPVTAYIFPEVVFGGIGFVALVVGSLGSDRAVAKLVGNRIK